MELEEESYNAGVTLDLFRANEKINARKKRRLAEEVHRVLASDAEGAPGVPAGAAAGVQPHSEAVRGVIQALFDRNRLVLYERNVAARGSRCPGPMKAGKSTWRELWCSCLPSARST